MVHLDRFIRHASHARFQQCLSESFACSQMKIGEKNLVPPQQWKLSFERFLDLHNHVGARENFFRLLDNLRAGFGVILVGIT